jgi:hypothetical protein
VHQERLPISRPPERLAKPVYLIFQNLLLVRGPSPIEEQIDDCLTAAKHMDREGLDDVIRLLRNARNAVVWKLGA